jgi:hypothetical protein
MPIAAVMKNPAGSRPGIRNLASRPTTKPIRIVQTMCMRSSFLLRRAGAHRSRILEPVHAMSDERR